MAKRNWTEDETTLALELYFRIPFGSIGSNNKEVIKLAELFKRTPSSVCMKLMNLAACDPKQLERGVHGLKNGSKLEPIIFNKYANDLASLVYDALKIKSKLAEYDIGQAIPTSEIQSVFGVTDLNKIPEGKYKESFIKTRIGQNYFRSAVLAAYNNQCCITGLNNEKLLIASHLKPWNVSDDKTEKTNPKNGLCLNPLHDKAFDKGLITINVDYKIIVSDTLKNSKMDIKTLDWFMSYEDKEIQLPDKAVPDKQFIEYHNKHIYLG